ncbi:MAG TPA: alpha/beta hydrolase [Candidatus Binataceae bacterium]|nr:alpha/beta hydrolase [Candidatus Binataceae bacterium]
MLDPSNQQILDELVAMGAPPIHKMTPADARHGDLIFAAACQGDNPHEQVGRIEDRTIAGPAGEIPLRIYTPKAAPCGALVFFHGGGWVVGSIEGHDEVCRRLTNDSGALVISVGYRLAPEHKFPAGVEDGYAATAWVAANAAALGYPAGRVAVGGDSAGGNLSAAISLIARDRGGPKLALQLLIYPAVTASLDWPSVKEFSGYFITVEDMNWFMNYYLRSADDAANPYACPMNAKDLRGLPPALVITAEMDPLRDQGEAYAARLREAGVPTTVSRYQSVTHAFVNMAPRVEAGRKAIKEAGAAARAALTS